MKKVLIVVTALLAFGCREKDPEEITPLAECSFEFSNLVAGKLTGATGQVGTGAEGYFIQRGSDRYAACNLPEHLQEVGKGIRFDAKVIAVPSNVRIRIAGTPIIITRIY